MWIKCIQIHQWIVLWKLVGSMSWTTRAEGKHTKPIKAHFHQRVWVGSVCKGAARVIFPPPKVGMTQTEPYEPYSQYLSRSTPPLRYWEPERVPLSLSYTHHPFIGRHSLPCDREIITNKHSTCKVFLDNCESFVYQRKCCVKVCHSLPKHCCLLFIHCAHSFSLDLFAGYTVGLLWDHNAYVAVVATTVRLKHCPTTKVLAAVETRAVTELYRTINTGMTHTHWWKFTISQIRPTLLYKNLGLSLGLFLTSMSEAIGCYLAMYIFSLRRF